MFSRLTEFDRTYDVLDELRRQMDRLWGDFGDAHGGSGLTGSRATQLAAASVPRFNLYEAGANVVLTADVPGMTEKDLAVSIEDGVLTISGERPVEAREGYELHRRERAEAGFARSIALPVRRSMSIRFAAAHPEGARQ